MKKIILTGATIILLTLSGCKGDNTLLAGLDSQADSETIIQSATIAPARVVTEPTCPKLLSYERKGWMGSFELNDLSSYGYDFYQDGTLISREWYNASNLGYIKTERNLSIPIEDKEKLTKEITRLKNLMYNGDILPKATDSGDFELTLWGEENKFYDTNYTETNAILEMIERFSEYYSTDPTTDFEFYFGKYHFPSFFYSGHRNDKSYHIYINNDLFTFNYVHEEYKECTITKEDLDLLKKALVKSNFMSFPKYNIINNQDDIGWVEVATEQGIFDFTYSMGLPEYKDIDNAVEKLIQKYFPE